MRFIYGSGCTAGRGQKRTFLLWYYINPRVVYRKNVVLAADDPRHDRHIWGVDLNTAALRLSGRFKSVGVALALAFGLLLSCGEGPAGPASDITSAQDVTSDGGFVPCQADGDCPSASAPCQERRCVAGACTVAPLAQGWCSDGNPCTVEDSCQAGVCVSGANGCMCDSDVDCANKGDGDQCKGALYCDMSHVPHTCRLNAASLVYCPKTAGTQCAANACDPTTGKCKLSDRVDGSPCNDANPCTVESACKAGKCVAAQASWCQCEATADCAAFDDTNACNGTLFCDTTTFPHACRVNPVTVVQCPSNDDSACQANTCNPTTSACAIASVADGTPCDDGDDKTKSEVCKAGKCVAGTNITICAKATDCPDDGDLCNGLPYCDLKLGTCAINPATVVQCPSAGDSACLKNTCQPTTAKCGMATVANTTPCDDGDPCTLGDFCLAGECKAGIFGCKCTTDSECVDKDDGDKCNGLPYCDKPTGKCETNPATVVICKTVNDTDCVKSTCVPATGQCLMAEQVTGTTCDDGDTCTKSDSCTDGACGGTFVCTCGSDADCTDDGDLCNGLRFCDKSDPKGPTCKDNPGALIVCPTVDDTACLKSTCVPKTGLCQMKTVADGLPCSDGNVCTKGDFCATGSCKSGQSSCACQTHADCLTSDDGDFCNGVPFCDLSGPKPKCVANPASAVFCPPLGKGPCLTNTCVPQTGACVTKPAAKGTSCDDGDVCTTADACAAGACVGGKNANCDDGDVCTVDSCTALDGCKHVAANCKDGNACTVDLCDAKSGKCAFDDQSLQGKGCDADQSGCTINDTCDAGTCKAGAAVECTLALKACQVAVCAPQGSSSFQCVAKAAANGAPCDDGAPCLIGDACVGGACTAGKSHALFAQNYNLGAPIAQPHATVALGSEGYALVGHQRAAGGKAPQGWFVVRVDAAGKAMWTRFEPSQSGDGAVIAEAVWDGGKGEVVVAGTWDGSKHRRARVLRYKADGKSVVSDIGYEAPGADVSVVAASDDGGGGARLVLQLYPVGAPSTGSLVRVAGGGTTLSASPFTLATATTLHAAAARLDGGTFVVGERSVGGGATQSRLMALTNGGGVQWSRPDAAAQTLHDVVAQGGDAVVVGGRDVGGVEHHVVLRVDAAGKTRWTAALLSPGRFEAVAARSDGSIVATGSVGSGTQSKVALFNLGAYGAVTWERTLGVAAPARGVALDALASGALVVASARVTKTIPGGVSEVDAGLLRVDAFGLASCSASGACFSASLAKCDDNKACTSDLCDAKLGCVHVAATGGCDDGNACSDGDFCKANVCVPGQPVVCGDPGPCKTASCDAKLGCVIKLATAGDACDDGSACTKGDVCDSKGGCAGKTVNCDDKLACTADACDAKTGCTHKGQDALCGDDNDCTDDACDAKLGCTHAGNSAPCDDGVACTVGAICADGVCKAGTEGKLWHNLLGILPNAVGVSQGWQGFLRSVAPSGELSSGVAYIAGGAIRNDINTGNHRCRALGIDGKGTKKWDIYLGNAPASGGSEQLTAAVVHPKGAMLFGYGTEKTGAPITSLGYGVAAADGATLWQFRYGQSGSDRIEAATQRHGGGAAAVGQTYDPVTKSQKGWLLFVSDLGFQIGSHQLGGPLDERIYSVTQFGTGYAMAGARWHPTEGSWVVTTDASGKMVWERELVFPDIDNLQRVVATADGGLVVAGNLKNPQNATLHVAALTGLGKVRWRFVIPKPFDIQPYGALQVGALRTTSNGDVLVYHPGVYPKLWRISGVDGAALAQSHYLYSQIGAYGGYVFGALGSIPVEDDGLLLVGGISTELYPDKVFKKDNYPQSQGAVVRLDGWGNFSCSAAGACADKTHKTCDDGQPCTNTGCAQGSCVHNAVTGRRCEGEAFCTAIYACDGAKKCAAAAPKLFDLAQDLNAPGSDSLKAEGRSAVTALADGGFVLTGSVRRGLPNNNTAPCPCTVHDALLARYDAAGNMRWKALVAPDTTITTTTSSLRHFNEVVERKRGGVVAVGYRALGLGSSSNVKYYGSIVTFDEIGNRLITHDVGPAALAKHPQGLSRVKSFGAVFETSPDNFVAVGTVSYQNGPYSGWVYGFRAEDTAITVKFDKIPQNNGGVTAAAVTSAGKLAVANYDGSIHYWSPLSGNVIAHLSAVGPGRRTYGLAASGDGVVAAGLSWYTPNNSGAQAGYVARFDKAYKLVWEKVFDGGDKDLFTDVRVLADGRIVAAGSAKVAGKGWQGRLLFLGEDGAQHAELLLGTTDSEYIADSDVLNNGSIIVAGQRGDGASSNGWVATVSPWGQSSCVTAGYCADLKGGACVDDNPCTADSCAANQGCTHVALKDGTECDGGKVCAGGLCK